MGPVLVSLPIHATLRGRLRALVVRELSSQGGRRRKGSRWAASAAGRYFRGPLRSKTWALLFPGLRMSDFPEVSEDAATTSICRPCQMLRRRPAYGTQSWACPALEKPRGAAPGRNRATYSETAGEKVPPALHVRAFRRRGSSRLPIKSLSAAVNRCVRVCVCARTR